MTDLADFYAPADAPQTDEERERFQVDNDGKCQWVLLKLARAEQELARINARADELVAHAEHFRRTASAGPKGDADFFRGAAADYHRRNLQPVIDDLTADGVVDKDAWQKVKGKTYPLPVGNLLAKRSQDTVEIVDESAFLEWAARNPEAIGLVKVKPSLSAIKELPRAEGFVLLDGKIVPGVRAVGGHVTFDAKATVTDEVPAWLPLPDEAA